MACAELLAMCLLSGKAGPAPRRQPLPIFHDTYNYSSLYFNADDGKLSFEEFKNYFSDGVLSLEELWELFSGIDRHHSDNVDTEKLCGKWAAAPALQTLLGTVHCWRSRGWLLPCFSPSLQQYENSSKMEQFLTRFLLRETVSQLQSLQTSLECAVDIMEEQAGRERKDLKKSETLTGLRTGRRCGRRGQKNICLSSVDPYSGMLTTGTCGQGRSHPHSPATPQVCARQPLLALLPFKNLLRRTSGSTMPILPEGAEPGVAVLGIPFTPAHQALSQDFSCPHSVSTCKLTNEACFILYEFWQDVSSWRSHLQSSHSKTFQRSIISLLEAPELLTTMLFPGEQGCAGWCGSNV
ncbi:NECA3 protein, partial [Nothoprocta ornata]|nr:NECA3 protein [Nothoprocta ornata]